MLASGIPLTMVGLDVTTKAVLNRGDEQEIRKVGSDAAEFSADILEFMFKRNKRGGEDALMHDALAVGVAINPSLVTQTEFFVDCECEGKYTSGHTFVAVTRIFKGEPNCSVAETLDLEAFKKWLIGALQKSAN